MSGTAPDAQSAPAPTLTKLLERIEGMYAESSQESGRWDAGYSEACRDILGDLRALAALESR